MRPFLILITCSAAALAQSGMPTQIPDAARRAAAEIQAAQLERDVRFLASDAMLGRATPSAQLDTAATYIATQLKTGRLHPFGDQGGYTQRVRFDVTAFSACSFVAVGNTRYTFPEDARLTPGRSSNDTATIEADAPLVYAQHGWVSKSLGIDPFKGLDVRGKIVVITAKPGRAEGYLRLPQENDRVDDLVNPARAAAERGAVALVLLPGPAVKRDSADDIWLGPMPRLRDSVRTGAAVLVAPWLERGISPALPTLHVSRRVADAMFVNEKSSGMRVIGGVGGSTATASWIRETTDQLPPAFALNPQTRLHLRSCGGHSQTEEARNVVAVVEGSDPQLKNEYIVIGAHYDGQGLHLPPVHGDSIMNSALDNATGAAGLISVASAFARGPQPKRSLVFVWFAGEEMASPAHLGSSYFLSHAPVPLTSMKLMINLDEIGPTLENAGIIDLGYSRPALLEFVQANADLCPATHLHPSVGMALGNNSDRAEFARGGIPILAFESDKGDDHSVTDEATKIDYAGLAHMSRCVYLLAWALGNRGQVP